MLGAITGDIVGSIYEFKNHRTKEFPFFGRGVFFTDDSVCTVALAHALLTKSPPAVELQGWCRRYPGRGYGGMFRRWIYGTSPEPYNSYGNGAAMRVSGAAWLAASLNEALGLADQITGITHNHPEGLRGARATCHAVHLALNGAGAERIRATVQETYGYDLSRSVDEIRPDYRFNRLVKNSLFEAPDWLLG